MNLYFQALTALLWFLWPLSTLAASVTLGDTLGDVPARAWAVVLVLSVVSGVMALLQRMNQALVLEQQLARADDADKPALEQALAAVGLPSGWRIFVCWHIAGAILAGVLAFFFLETTTLSDYLKAVGIAMTSYGGAKLFDKTSTVFAERVIAAVAKKVDDEKGT